MTTDEAHQTGGRGQRTRGDDDFSSEDYVDRPIGSRPAGDSADTEVLGSIPGEHDEMVEGADALPTDEAGETESCDADGGSGDNEAESRTGDDVMTPVAFGSDNGSDNDEAGAEGTDAVEDAAAVDDDGSDTAHDGTHVEMRQVAGLTAGSMMKLNVGRAFEFNESNDGGSFSLRVLENGEVIVHPGSAHAIIDEVEVDEPMLVGDGLLNVSSACFSIRRPRPPASSESRMESIGAAFASISAIGVPALGAEEPLPADQLTGSRLGTIINRNPSTKGEIGRGALNFLQSIRQSRSVVAERHRLLHPDPEELKTRLSRLDPGLWERSHDHPLFGRFSVGYASIPWEPRFDNPELIPELLHEPIVEMSVLPWVPVTANLLYGPLGIVGKRAARLAACRHAILSMAALSMPGEIEFAVRSGENTATSWNWMRALPPIMSANEVGASVITVIDGPDGARVDEAARQAASDRAAPVAAELDSIPPAEDDVEIAVDPAPTADVPEIGPEATEPGRLNDADELDLLGSHETPVTGYILLADSVDELTRTCGMILQIEPDGTGSVTNHLNETIQVTPIGVTEAFAHDMATRIADILTDSFL